MKIHRVAVTGAGGQIAYSLLFRIAAGELFGPHQKVALHLLETPEAAGSLAGVAMELWDCAFPLLHEVKIGSDPVELFGEVDVAFLVGAKPRGPGMERKDLLSENGKIFVGQGKALSQSASKGVQVLVVGNPCNTNCLIALHNAPNLSPKQFYAMTRLDEHRARYQLAHKAGAQVHEVSHMTIWGNHSSTQVPDFLHAEIRGKKVPDVILDRKWLESDFFSIVQKRGAEVIAARGKSSAASAAHAALSAMRSIVEPHPSPKEWTSMGVYTEGNPYGIDPDLVFSFPFQSKGKGEWEIVKGIHLDSFLKEKISLTQKELKEERDLIAPLLRGK